MAVSEHKSRSAMWLGRSGSTRRPALGQALLDDLAKRFESEQDRWFLWSPVVLGVGIGAYFSFESEPEWWWLMLPFVAGCLAAWKTGASRAGTFALALAVAIAGFGLLVAKFRAQIVASPVLTARLGPVMVEGWIERLELKPSGRISALLLVAGIERLAHEKTPKRIQLTMAPGLAPQRAGETVRVLSMLRPPPRPVAPGAYNFSKRAWFRGIGAYGHSLAKPVVINGREAGGGPALNSPGWSHRAGVWIDGVRGAAAARVMAVIGDKGGPVAAALLTGMRGAIPKSDLGAIRDAGLAHLLAISGLHMGLMSGAAFWAIRFAIAAFPWLALRVVGKKWAAGAGLLVGAVYFLLAGGSVATERAFIMVAVALAAIMVDRPAISMRNAALAALFILIMKPETLGEIGFQMSFAAVIALTAFYERVVRRPGTGMEKNKARPPPRGGAAGAGGRVFKFLSGVLLTTLIASLATGPLAAFQFNRVAVYGLAANLVAVPLVGFAVMPLGLVALVLMPFGLDAQALAVMGAGTAFLVEIARTVADWPGAAVLVASPPATVQLVFVIGGLWLCLWRREWRFWGLMPVCGVFAIAALARAPDIYVGENGRRVAVRAESGQLSVSPGRGGRYMVSQWLRRDGDARTISEATARGRSDDPLACDRHACVATLKDSQAGNYRFAFVRHPAALTEECRSADIVIVAFPVYGRCKGPALTIDRFGLHARGSHAVYLNSAGPAVTTVAGAIGNRPWRRNYNSSGGKRRPGRPGSFSF